MEYSDDVDGLEVIYEDPAVRRRVWEYLGGDDLGRSATAAYLARSDGRGPTDIEHLSVADLDLALSGTSDLARSLLDSESHIIHLDIEYVDFDSPGAAFVDPWRAFRLQEPVIDVIEEELTSFGIAPLHLLTGQGHHFVWRVPRNSAVALRLEREISPRIRSAKNGDAAGSVFEGIGLVMEFLGQRIVSRAAEGCSVPVEMTAVNVGPGSSGRREMISIDISEYGDPIEQRVIRIPFTHYQKPWRSGIVDRFGLSGEVPSTVALPLHEIDVTQALKLRQDANDVLSLARRASVAIPVQATGTARLVEAYETSELSRFHRQFYHYPEETEVPLSEGEKRTFPACVGEILTYPNDLLLKPAGIQTVARFLLSQGWHPMQIANLVASRFAEEQHHWPGRYWSIYSPRLRAEFYVRIFSGAVHTGLDGGIDFNCVSTQEKGFCPRGGCDQNLSDYRNQLKGRRK